MSGKSTNRVLSFIMAIVMVFGIIQWQVNLKSAQAGGSVLPYNEGVFPDYSKWDGNDEFSHSMLYIGMGFHNKDAIPWRVLEINEADGHKEALVMSDILFPEQRNGGNDSWGALGSGWESSNLRDYFAKQFNAAGNQSNIEFEMPNAAKALFKQTETEPDVKDYIFFLSKEEASEYVPEADGMSLIQRTTMFNVAVMDWWTRTPVEYNNNAVYTFSPYYSPYLRDNRLKTNGQDSVKSRPAARLDLTNIVFNYKIVDAPSASDEMTVPAGNWDTRQSYYASGDYNGIYYNLYMPAIVDESLTINGLRLDGNEIGTTTEINSDGEDLNLTIGGTNAPSGSYLAYKIVDEDGLIVANGKSTDNSSLTAETNGLSDGFYNVFVWSEWSGSITVSGWVYYYAITATVPENFEIKIGNPPEGIYSVTVGSSVGGRSTAKPSKRLSAGDIVTLAAVSDSNYEFVKWNIGEVVWTEGNETTAVAKFVMPEGNIIVTPEFKAKAVQATYGITVNIAEGGTANASKLAEIAAGESVTITASPEQDYSFANWNISPEVTFTSGNINSSSATFLMPEGNVSITPVFQSTAVATYAITINNPNGGTANASKTTGITTGETINITALPKEDYTFVRWSIVPNVTYTSGSQTSASAAFAMPSSNITVTPVFKSDNPIEKPDVMPNDGVFPSYAKWNSGGVFSRSLIYMGMAVSESEAIAWRVLEINETDGGKEALVLSDLQFSQPNNNGDSSWGELDSVWSNSNQRRYFANLFNGSGSHSNHFFDLPSNAKPLFKETETEPEVFDYLFFLSLDEVTNYVPDLDGMSLMQGAYSSGVLDKEWWTRTTIEDDSDNAYAISSKFGNNPRTNRPKTTGDGSVNARPAAKIGLANIVFNYKVVEAPSNSNEMAVPSGYGGNARKYYPSGSYNGINYDFYMPVIIDESKKISDIQANGNDIDAPITMKSDASLNLTAASSDAPDSAYLAYKIVDENGNIAANGKGDSSLLTIDAQNVDDGTYNAYVWFEWQEVVLVSGWVNYFAVSATVPEAFELTVGNALPLPNTKFDASDMKLTDFFVGQKYSTMENDWNDITAADVTRGYIEFDEYDDLNLDYGIRVQTIANADEISEGYENSKIKIINLSRFDEPAGLIAVPLSGAGQTNGRIAGVNSGMEYKPIDSGNYVPSPEDEIVGLAAGSYLVRYKGEGHTLASFPVTKTIRFSAPVPSAVFTAQNMKLSNLKTNMVYKIGGAETDGGGWVPATSVNITLQDSDFENASPLVIYVKELGEPGISKEDSEAQVINLTRNSALVTGVTRKNLSEEDGTDGELYGLLDGMEYRNGSAGAFSSDFGSNGTKTGLFGGTYYIRYKGEALTLPGASAVLIIEYKNTRPTTIFDAYTRILTGVTNEMEYTINGGYSWTRGDGNPIDFTETTLMVHHNILVRRLKVEETDIPMIQTIELSKHATPTAITHTDINGAAKGVISGVNSSMEVKYPGALTYQNIVDTTLTNLEAGTYFVRVRGFSNNDIHTLASDEVVIRIIDTTIANAAVENLDRRAVTDLYAMKGDGSPLPAITRLSDGVGKGNAVTVYGAFLAGHRPLVQLSDGKGFELEIMPIQVDPYGQYLRFIWPDDLAAGVYIVKASNDNGLNWSVQEGYLNRPDASWVSDPGAYTGMEINLFGRNLDARQYDKSIENSESPTMVRVVRIDSPNSSSGTLIQTVKPHIVTPYRLAFNAPPMEKDKLYVVQVCVSSAGIGGEWVTAMKYPDAVERLVLTGTELPIYDIYPDRPDPNRTVRSMNVSWAGIFNWDKVFDVTKEPYNLDVNETSKWENAVETRDTIQLAIDDAAAYTDPATGKKGGVVYLPAGTYNIIGSSSRRSGLYLPDYVILQGAGKDANDEYLTVIDFDLDEFIVRGDFISVVKTKSGSRGYQGILGIKSVIGTNAVGAVITKLPSKAEEDIYYGMKMYFAELGYPGYGASHMFLYDCNIDHGILTRRHRGMSLTGSKILVAENTTRTGLMPMQYEKSGEYFIYRNNVIRFGDGNYNVFVDYQTVMDNDIEAEVTLNAYAPDGNPEGTIYVTEDVHGIFIYGNKYHCAYVANNRIANMASYRYGASEGIGIDAVYGFAMSETITKAGATTLTFAENYTAPGVNWNDDIYSIMITEGTGIGQMRMVKSISFPYGPRMEQDVVIDKPWDVIPDHTSKISVGQAHIGNIIEKNNIGPTYDCGVQLYRGCWDNIVSDNYLHQTKGIIIEGTNNTSMSGRASTLIEMSFHNQVRNNECIEFTPRLAKDVVIQETGVEFDSYVRPWGPQLFGNEFRNNLVDKTDKESDYSNMLLYETVENFWWISDGFMVDVWPRGEMGNNTGFMVFSYGEGVYEEQGRIGRRIVGSLYEDSVAKEVWGYKTNWTTGVAEPRDGVAFRITPASGYGVLVKNMQKDDKTKTLIDDGGINTFVWQDDQKGIVKTANAGFWNEANWSAVALSGGGQGQNAVAIGAEFDSLWTTTETGGKAELVIDTLMRDLYINDTKDGEPVRINTHNPYRVIDKIEIEAVAVSGTFKLYAAAVNGGGKSEETGDVYDLGFNWGEPVLTIEDVELSDLEGLVYLDDVFAEGRYFKLEFADISGNVSIKNVNLFPYEESMPSYRNYDPWWENLGPPSEPRNVRAAATNETVTLTWVAPLSLHGSNIEGYKIHVIGGSDEYAGGKEIVIDSPDVFSKAITGLENDVEYMFKVCAQNEKGYGDYSAPIAAVPTNNVFKVFATATPGGVIDSEAEDVVPGEKAYFKLVPDLGMRIADNPTVVGTDNGVAVQLISGAGINMYEFTMPAFNVTISCKFEKAPVVDNALQIGVSKTWLDYYDSDGNFISDDDVNVIANPFDNQLGETWWDHKVIHLYHETNNPNWNWMPQGGVLYFEFDNTYDISEIFLKQLYLSENEVRFETSLDGENWQYLLVEDRYNTNWQISRTYKLDPPIKANYMRMIVPGSVSVSFPYGVRISGTVTAGEVTVGNAVLHTVNDGGVIVSTTDVADKVNDFGGLTNGFDYLTNASAEKLYIEIDLDTETALEITEIKFGKLDLLNNELIMWVSETGEEGSWVEIGRIDTEETDGGEFGFDPSVAYAAAKHLRIEIPKHTNVNIQNGISISVVPIVEDEIVGIGIFMSSGDMDALEVYRESPTTIIAKVGTVYGDNSELNKAVTWSIIGPDTLRQDTKITEIDNETDRVVLTAARHEKEQWLTLRATSVENPSVFTDVQVEIADYLQEKEISTVQISGGMISVSKNNAYMDDLITVTITPNSGYVISGTPRVSVSTVGVAHVENTTYTFVMPDENITVSCDFTDADASFTVNFVTNGGSAVTPVTVKASEGGFINKKDAVSVRSGHVLTGWYEDSNLTKRWNFATDGVSRNGMTLYAKWIVEKEDSFIPRPLAEATQLKKTEKSVADSNYGYEIKMKNSLEVSAIGYPVTPITRDHTVYIYDITSLNVSDSYQQRYNLTNGRAYKLKDYEAGLMVAKATFTPSHETKDGYYCQKLDKPVILQTGRNYVVFSTEYKDDIVTSYFGLDENTLYKRDTAQLWPQGMSNRISWSSDCIPLVSTAITWMDGDEQWLETGGASVGQTFWYQDLGPDGENFNNSGDVIIVPEEFYTVRFDLNGGVSNAANLTQTVKGGTFAVEPLRPSKDGFVFAGWSLTDGGRTVDVTKYVVNGDTTFHASWLDEKLFSIIRIEINNPPIKTSYRVGERFDPSGMTILVHYSTGVYPDEIPVTRDMITGDRVVTVHYAGNTAAYLPEWKERSSSKQTEEPAAVEVLALAATATPKTPDTSDLTITAPRGNEPTTVIIDGKEVTIPPGMTLIFDLDEDGIPLSTFNIVWENPLKDVSEDDWFYEFIKYVYTHGYMSGTAEDVFSPDLETTRGMIVTILYNIMGRPDVSEIDNVFDDVNIDSWYADAVKWAYFNGIIKGYGDGNFGPENEVTRQDLITILVNYANFIGMEFMAARDYQGFADDGEIADYAKEPVELFFTAGIINGYPDGEFKPQGSATRAETAAILYKLLGKR